MCGPKVGLRASGQPWALGRNPVGIGGAGSERRWLGEDVMDVMDVMGHRGGEREDARALVRGLSVEGGIGNSE
jgi:hypothetical protein